VTQKAGTRRVVICNVYPDDNRGSSALTAAAIDAARAAFPGCSISLVTVGSGQTEQLYRHTRVRYPDVELLRPPIAVRSGPLDGLAAAARSLRLLLMRPGPTTALTISRILDADLVVSRGGFLFVDHGSVRRLLSLWLTAFPLVLASRFGIPTVVYAATVGPFTHPSWRILVRWILRRLTLVLVRGPRSYQEAISLGLEPARVSEMPDGVFGATPPGAGAGASVAKRFGLLGHRFGAVTIPHGQSPVDQDGTFSQRLAALIRELLGSGVLERMAVVVQVDGSLVSDAGASLELARLVDDDRLTVIRQDLRPEDLIALYGTASLVIGGRLHSAIFSLVAGTPAFAFAMNGTKSADVFESLGLGRFVIPAPTFDPQAVLAATMEVVARGDSMRSEIRRVTSEAHRRVVAANDLLRLAVTHGSGDAGLRKPTVAFQRRDRQ